MVLQARLTQDPGQLMAMFSVCCFALDRLFAYMSVLSFPSPQNAINL